jgi:ATP-binding cassette subfamily B protein/subfamily B ATP-binding cassette protein MsbA
MIREDKSSTTQPLSTWKLSVWLLRFCGSGEGTKIFIGLLLLLSGSGIALLQPWPLKLVVDSVLGNHETPAFLSDLTTWVTQDMGIISNPQYALLGILCGSMLLIQLLMGSLTVLSTYTLVGVGLRMVFRLRCRLFDHLQRLSLAFHDNTPVGDSLYRVTWDTYCVQALLNSGMIPALTATFTLLGIAGIMLSLDWLLTLVALAMGLPLVILIRGLDRPMTDRSLRFHERESQISTRVQETMTGIRAVQAFGQEASENRRFMGHAEESLRANLRLTVLQSGSQGLVGLLLALGTAVVIGIGATRAVQGLLTVGDIVLLVSYLAMLYKPLETLASTAAVVQSAAASGRRVWELLETSPDVFDRPHALSLPKKAIGPIIFNQVSFYYQESQPVLRDIYLEIPPGQRVAIVGPSGAGKTTLANLLPRFHDPTYGQVTLNGYDLRHLTLDSLRRNIALVHQEPVLFCTTIQENIAYGRPQATSKEIESAAQAAGAHAFIRDLPDGYDTKVGERGATLSGGQRQRIAIARAFLKDAPILIMDEPTSSLDAETEHALLEALKKLMEGRTTIIIAHRLSTVREADRIILLQNGTIVESGTHTELLLRDELYGRLYHTQFGYHAALPNPAVQN